MKWDLCVAGWSMFNHVGILFLECHRHQAKSLASMQITTMQVWDQGVLVCKQSNWQDSNLLSFLLIRGTKLYEWGTQWDSNSLVKICKYILLITALPKAPRFVISPFFRDSKKVLLSFLLGKVAFASIWMSINFLYLIFPPKTGIYFIWICISNIRSHTRSL